MGKLTKAQHITEAAHAHTNLTMMYAVIALAESGCFHGHVPALREIIRIAKADAGRSLRLYDKHSLAALTFTASLSDASPSSGDE